MFARFAVYNLKNLYAQVGVGVRPLRGLQPLPKQPTFIDYRGGVRELRSLQPLPSPRNKPRTREIKDFS